MANTTSGMLDKQPYDGSTINCVGKSLQSAKCTGGACSYSVQGRCPWLILGEGEGEGASFVGRDEYGIGQVSRPTEVHECGFLTVVLTVTTNPVYDTNSN